MYAVNNRFNTILIPVNFTVSTEVAIQKALTLCPEPGTTFHLLYVCGTRPGSLFYPDSLMQKKEIAAGARMDHLVAQTQGKRDDIYISGSVIPGDIETVIALKAKEINADLVVIGKNSHHSWLPFLNTVVPSRLAKKTGIAILTVKPGSIDHPIRTVVIPVSDHFPEKKMAIVNSLRKKSWITIRLVTFTGRADSPPQSLLHAYRFLKNNLGNDVSCKVLHGSNKAKAILRYCEKVDADLLIVTPESETRVGWLNKHISDVLPVESKTQVLAIGSA